MQVTSSCFKFINEFKAQMKKEFEMLDLGTMNYFLDMEVYKLNREFFFLSQQKYSWDVLKKFKMEQCKSIAAPLVPNIKFFNHDGKPKMNLH